MTGWQTLKLPDCLEKAPKASKIPRKAFLASGEYPIVSQEQSLVNGYWNDSGDVVSVDRPVVVFGDHSQTLKIVDFDFVVGADGVKILKPRPFIDAKYLYYFLLGHPIKDLGYARHYRLLKELDIRFPDLSEQKRIVAILDEAFTGIDAAIANTERNLANVKQLLSRYRDSIFADGQSSWEETTLGDLYHIGSGKRVHKKDWRSSGVPFYRAREIVKLAEHGSVKNELFISEKLFEKYKEKTGAPGAGDLMVTAVGTLGICYVVQPSDRFYFKDASVLWFRPKREVNEDFIKHAFRSDLIRKQTTDSQGATVGTLTISRANSISLSIPTLERQRMIASDIAAFESEVTALRSVYQRKLDALNELKQCLLEKAFNCELSAESRASGIRRTDVDAATT